VKIVDLAKNLIRLSGNSIDEIGIQYSGVRPGEKLFEELLKKDEVHEQQIYPKIYIGKKAELYLPEIEELISTYSNLDKEEIREKLLNLANNKVIAKPKLSISV
jgi:FlaA1/EpsC-like NDP-sugar epimerase